MTRRSLTITTVVLTAAVTMARAQMPSTDIYLLPVDGSTIGTPSRVTDRPEYDNQPRFLENGKFLVYSAMGAEGTDILVYDLATGASRVLLATPESEYSPTPIPHQQGISVVRDYGDFNQQLWRFPLDGSEPELLLAHVGPVGYHAWVNDNQVILYILGEPPTLQLADTGEQTGRVLGPSPGRALAKVPGSNEMSFVDKSGDDWWLTAIDTDTGATRPLIKTLPGREDCAWAPDGAVWMGDDSRLYRWQPGEDNWQPVADLDALGIYGITRLTFSPDGSRLALVGQRPPADLAAAYRQEAGRLLGAALVDTDGWEKLDHLATVIGHRLSGSQSLEQAIDWAAERMTREGLTVRKQPAMVPHWVRGNESAELIAPVKRTLPMLGLGNSVGTPPEGITAPVVVVSSFAELDALGREKVEGHIVLYAVEWRGYGYTVQFRARGPSRAAALGAVAVLTRSATGHSLATPHTGALDYDEEVPKIPAAAVTPEDAAWMQRLAARGENLVVTLKMEARMLPDAESFNVIAEIPGSERPEEVVVMGGHYDSWDVGQGVHDDGAACIAAWQALRIIQQLGLAPRRTLRAVLWTNEENGVRGGKAYKDALSAEELERHVAAIEMDGGVERPVGFGFSLPGGDPEGGRADAEGEPADPVYEAAMAKLEQIARLLESIDADGMRRGGGGVDIGPLMRAGVPGLGLNTVLDHYFDWHHTHADTLDKVDIRDFRKAIAALGIMGYVLADMPERLVPTAGTNP
jgi:carboxypeptidase Q